MYCSGVICSTMDVLIASRYQTPIQYSNNTVAVIWWDGVLRKLTCADRGTMTRQLTTPFDKSKLASSTNIYSKGGKPDPDIPQVNLLTGKTMSISFRQVVMIDS